jgi:phosphopantothenoylcysteine decarboxylase / phosphopantothenate---cysteine ligase
MARIVITSGPTRQYLDPVRYLTNASSGRMGAALAATALNMGHEVVVVTGPVAIAYPSAAEIVRVVTTEEMLEATHQAFTKADGLIGAAAPCDYRPMQVQSQKMTKTGEDVLLRLVETSDVVATLGKAKLSHQWVVGFALETEDRRFRAIVKLQKKFCDLMVSNGPAAIDSSDNDIEILDATGKVVSSMQASKEQVAAHIMEIIQSHLIDKVASTKLS